MQSGIRLLPVVEFDPFEFRLDRSSPERPEAEDTEGWARFWRACLAEADIHELTPLENTWVVPVEQLQAEGLLAKVVATHTGEASIAALLETLPGPFDPRSGMNAEGESIEEFVGALRGGLALAVTDPAAGPVIAPECCGDLGNWRDWLNATRVETEAWQDLWIGHPSARVARIAGNLLVQKVQESGDCVGVPVVVDPAELIAAVESAKAELDTLAERLMGVVSVPSVPRLLAERITRRLSGLAEFDLD